MFKDNELYRHAERELNKLVELERTLNSNTSIEELEKEVEQFGGKTPQEFINDEILKVVASIDPQIHSLRSAPYVLEMAYKLVQLENILPLTLEDSEFIEVGRDAEDNITYQNTRNIKVFKDATRGVYHVDGQAALDFASGIYPVPEGVEEVQDGD